MIEGKLMLSFANSSSASLKKHKNLSNLRNNKVLLFFQYLPGALITLVYDRPDLLIDFKVCLVTYCLLKTRVLL
jgi:hypothetical protein